LGWSAEQLDQRRRAGSLYLKGIAYAEMAVRIEAEADLQAALADLGIRLERSPTSALFMAGQAFWRYRLAGGPRTAILPDLSIGAHAQIARWPILTRDVRRYRTFFPVWN
jgi:predicted nucleic acid-binding protein